MDLPAKEAITASGRKMRTESGQQIPGDKETSGCYLQRQEQENQIQEELA